MDTATTGVPLRDAATHERLSQFLSFFEYLNVDHRFHDTLESMRRKQERRFLVSLDTLRDYNPSLAEGLIVAPMDYFQPLEMAFQSYVLKSLEPETSEEANRVSSLPWHVGVIGSFGSHAITPRQLGSIHLSHMIEISGIVSSCSLIRPQLQRSVHFSQAKQTFYAKDYRDPLMNEESLSMNNAYPKQDPDGNPLTTHFGLSSYVDRQMITLQELPEEAPPGQLPRRVDIQLMDDLCDAVKPGDRIRVTGIYRAMASVQQGAIPSHFRVLVLANSIRDMNEKNSLSHTALSDEDIAKMKSWSKKRNIFHWLSQSLAPSIYGHSLIKQALLLQLLGGVERTVNQIHLRGDVNILLMGDPSTAKSQLLRFVYQLAPLAITTTGRGSSGVGLTAAVVQDKETGERRLEAGAMVLADRGIICIDEFDKMSDMDRVAIHEVMEQQTVTIAKAGMHVQLNARCSVLAAANPAYGQYQRHLTPQENIRLPDSLLSRFDLVFLVLDEMDAMRDRFLANHVLLMHRNADKDNHSTNNSHQNNSTIELDDESVCPLEWIKKYIYYAKQRFSPILTPTARQLISETYVQFRVSLNALHDNTSYKAVPVTPRTLETLIRLSTAHAKCRLSARVTRRDVRVARALMAHCLYARVEKPNQTTAAALAGGVKKRRVQTKEKEGDDEDEDDDEDDDDDSSDDDDVFNFRSTRMKEKELNKAVEKMTVKESNNELNASNTLETLVEASLEAMEEDSLPLKQDAMTAVQNALRLFMLSHAQEGCITLQQLLEQCPEFSLIQIETVLKTMEQNNQVMYRDQKIYFI